MITLVDFDNDAIHSYTRRNENLAVKFDTNETIAVMVHKSWWFEGGKKVTNNPFIALELS